MALGSREVSFIINVDSGKCVRAELGSGITQTGPNPNEDPPFKASGIEQNAAEQQEEQNIGQEIADNKRTRMYMRVCEITHTRSSPGCIYWDGVRFVRYC